MTPPSQVGGPCFWNGDCAIGSACFGDRCYAWCFSGADCSGGATCAPTSNEFAGNQKLGKCLAEGCSLRNPTSSASPFVACQAGWQCLYDPTSTPPITWCYGTPNGDGGAGTGAFCIFDNDCAPGTACYNAPDGGLAACWAWCRTNTPSDCPTGSCCSLGTSAPTQEGTTLGYCKPTCP
jgi:hypothetical protein